MAFLVLGANSVSGYTVKNSLRFNSGSSDYLNRTPASAGNRQKFTISLWVKRSGLSSSTTFRMLTAGSDGTEFLFSDDKLRFYYYNGSYIGQYFYQNPNALFRDVSAWYHVMVAVDTTQATAGDRVKMYVNGVEGAYAVNTMTQNASTDWNNTVVHNIGKFSNGSLFYYDGYMSEIYNIDGQQLTPSSFAESDFDTGIWKPKAYTGTYGTNGFYLKFANSASLGTDSSGNGNTFTVNNLTSIDQTTDTPTNNFATMSALLKNADTSLTEGALQVTGTSSSINGTSGGSFATSNVGKWYYEIKVTNIISTTYPRIGMLSIDDSNFGRLLNGDQGTAGYTTNGVSYFANGQKYYNNATSSFGSAISANNIVMIAIDMDNGASYVGINGTWQNSGVPTSGSSKTGALWTWTSGSISGVMPTTSDYNGSVQIYNFGNPPYSGGSYTDSAGFGNFSYAVPSGFYALCTKNLSTQG